MNIARLAVLALVLANPACSRGQGGASEWSIQATPDGVLPCLRPAAVEREPGATVVLSDAPRFCDVVAVPVATLDPSPAGLHPDPGAVAVMTTDGRYLTRGPSLIAVWDASGGFVSSLGSAGEGPGEFVPRGAVQPFIGANDSLYVLDGAQRWTVFGPDLGFRRVFLGPASGRDRGTMHITPHGVLTTGDLVAGGSPLSFHLMDLDGALVRSFGPPAEAAGAPAGRPRQQLSAYDGGAGFWVVPPSGARRGLVLEYWTFQGERLVTLERQVPWLPGDGYPPVLNDPSEPLLPEYDLLHVDADGLIWVAVVVRDARWRPVQGPEKAEVVAELYDARLEVIDAAAGVVLASFVYDGPEEILPPFASFFPRTSRSYRSMRDSLGLPTLEVFDVYLAAKRRSG